MSKKLALFLLPLNVLIDTLLLFSEQLYWLPLLRAGALLLLLVYVLLFHFRNIRRFSWLLLFLVYCIAQLFFVSDFQKSAIITMKILIPIAYVMVGFCLFNNLAQLRRLSISIIWVYLILILNFVFSQLFNLGSSVYSEDSNFRVGNLDDSWNVFTYAVLMAPFVLHFIQEKKAYSLLTRAGAWANGLLVLISLKRIAILGLLTGTAIRLRFGSGMRQIVRTFMVVFVGAALLYPLLQDVITERIEARSSRFESGALEREGRYLESQFVWSDALSFDSPAKSLFGLEGFNSVGNYANGAFGDRQLHVDYNLMLNTIGFVGLILYLALFIQLAFQMKFFQKRVDLPDTTRTLLISVFWMLLINQFITSFAGQMYHISYRLIVFVFLGAILGTFNSSSHARAHRLQR